MNAKTISKEYLYSIRDVPLFFVKKNIKSIRLSIKPDRIEIRAPFYIKKSQILSILEDERPKIIKALDKLLDNKKTSYDIFKETNDPTIFKNLKSIRIFGEDLKVKFKDNIEKLKYFNNSIYFPTSLLNLTFNEIELELFNFLRAILTNYLNNRLDYWQRLTNLYCNDFSLMSWKSYWGRCFIKDKHLEFNIALISLPKVLIDYIILHELCHLEIANHSKGFHDLLNKYMPDEREKSKILKNYSIKPNYFNFTNNSV